MGRIKKEEVRNLIGKFHPDFVCLQESKYVDHSVFSPNAICGGGVDVGWVVKNYIWLSGEYGVDKGKFESYDVWCVDGAVVVVEKRIGSGKEVVIVNIYNPCDSAGKEELWSSLKGKIQISNLDCWCLIGDLDVVMNGGERKGRAIYQVSSTMRKLEEFIDSTDLVDIPLSGKKFTWSRLDGRCCNHIDRALVSNSWLVEWDSCSLRGLPKGSFDHYPMFLHYAFQNWDPKPFCFFNT